MLFIIVLVHNSGKQYHLQTQIKNNRRSMDTLWVWGFCSFVSPHSYRSLFYRTAASLIKQGCVPQWNSFAEMGQALHLQTSVAPSLNTHLSPTLQSTVINALDYQNVVT